MRKIFLDAESLLSSVELIHLTGGTDPGESEDDDKKTENRCDSCMSCSSCTSCSTCTTCSTKTVG